MALNVTIKGKGPDLVLLHGWAFNHTVWGGITPHLTPHFRLHLVDLPGYGKSSQVLTKIDDLATLSETVLDATPVNAHWLGWSLGSMIVMHIAANQPQRVNKLISVAGTPRFVSATDWAHGLDTAIFNQFADNLASDVMGTLQRFIQLQVMGNSNATQLTNTLRYVLSQTPRPHRSVLGNGLTILQNSTLLSSLPCITQATLLIHGEDDKLVPFSVMNIMHHLINNSQCFNFQKTGHAPFINSPERFAKTVINFLHD